MIKNHYNTTNGGQAMKTKYKIWDKGQLVPAYTRLPKDPRAEKLSSTTAQERKLGIKYYIPAEAIAKELEG